MVEDNLGGKAAVTRRRAVRREGALVFGACLVVVVASFLLTPDPKGYGTHQQLFLPPCLFHLLTGLPCAFCGMTTGFALMARGQVSAALSANLMAPVGFVLTVVVGVLGLVAAICGRSFVPALVKHPRAPTVFAVGLLVVWAANVILHLQL
ncbi:MAG: DUF2752 domain-containing protein [Armatimonadia bacterium]